MLFYVVIPSWYRYLRSIVQIKCVAFIVTIRAFCWYKYYNEMGDQDNDNTIEFIQVIILKSLLFVIRSESYWYHLKRVFKKLIG